MNNAKELFPKGTRVRLTQYAIENHVGTAAQRAGRLGTVIGWNTRGGVRVNWDNTRQTTIHSYAASFIEIAPNAEAEKPGGNG